MKQNNNTVKAWQSYVSEDVRNYISGLIHKEFLIIKIKNPRLSKLGDYFPNHKGPHLITINSDLSPYSFVLTLCHELAHYFANKRYGFSIKPHGEEWKTIFKSIMEPVLDKMFFDDNTRKHLCVYLQDPKASSYANIKLKKCLLGLKDGVYLEDIREGVSFKMKTGRVFKLIEKKRSRAKCLDLSNNRLYSIHQGVNVMPLI